MTGSASLSVSQDKIKSNFDSVQEQTGLFAGKDGYQINVGEHTQLNGAVIASTASTDKNKLNTGSLGWTDIGNKADFSSQHQSVSGGTGGDLGSTFMGNMGSLLLVGANNNGHDSSTTYSAVSGGEITIRDKPKQQQDLATLSRDVEHASNALSPIFDKEKEQKRLRQAQLIGEIGNQSMDIIRTQGAIEASKAAQSQLTEEQRNMPGANPNASYEDRQKYIAVLQATDAYKKTMASYGTGSSLQQAAQAVTAAVQGLAGGNLGQALMGASAPYLAETIKKMTQGNEEARIMAHAVLGAVSASVQAGNAGAGAAGAAVAAAGTEAIMQALYGTKDVSSLSETQKQTVSALMTLAGGISGAVVGGDSASTLAGAQSGKNATENNDMFSLPPGLMEYGQAATSLAQFGVTRGDSNEVIAEAQRALVEGRGFEGPEPVKGLIQAWTIMMAGPLSAAELSVGAAGMVLGAAISGGANVSYQLSKGELFSYTDAFIASVVGGLTQGKGFVVTQGVSLSGSYAGSLIKGEDPVYPMLGTFVGTAIGFKGGHNAQ